MPAYPSVLSLVALQAALLFTPVAAAAQQTDRGAGQGENRATRPAVRTQSGQQIPAGALGIAQIDAPRVATLLQLRGMTGHGTVTLRGAILGDATLRGEGEEDCLSLPVRFVAGDFGGENISVQAAEPIRLIIRTQRVARTLAEGGDVVSDMYRIATLPDDPDADIVIESGLGASHGFVLNPGSSVAADIFGASVRHVTCTEQ
ncbi:hypothetical protein CLV41_1011037 [Roseibium marinum]|uniref:Uncharacterized protein n=2 Tax=Roseibium marinum TaxID=281252 RepID=A0A2S3V3P7_9HYPH|nr:hypothetical protein CLV41_1011037 [Roseibium marinum]